MRLNILLPVSVWAVGCAHTGMRMPGPTGQLGKAPTPYRDTLDEPVPVSSPEAVAQSAPSSPSERAEAKPPPPPPRRRARGDGAAVARAAGQLVGRSRLVVGGETYRYDCSGLVEAAHAKAGEALSGSSASLFALSRQEGVLHRKKVPQPGDVAFFDDTYDRNRNGRRDDDLTHVAIVEQVDRDGTITLVHKGSKGVTRLTMNLKHPEVRRDEDGKSLNDHLRASSNKDRGPTLSGQLWRAFGSLWALDEPLADSATP